ncbi:hypothetical protein SBOR_8015 [Sclerotinia borealis F-4128]|uniref:RRM domain-containing protein n=1 Tax=Sclerotinia borealis (strain F-4128) TaxID=1432307 RepID=W9C6X6_SCLBF|nr:hypothetical protein SBOR_8015 [Sclerotinia borealis F-4128]
MFTSQSGTPRWGIGPSSDRSSSTQSEHSHFNSPSSSSCTARHLCPTTQISSLSLNPLAPPFDLAAGAPQFFPPPPSRSPPIPPAFADTSPFNHQQQVIDRQQNILKSIQNRNLPLAMAPLNLPTGQPAPNAFQFNNNIYGFPPSLSSLQNTSQESANSNDSFRTQVPLPWNLPSEYENNGAVAIPDPSPFADPPLPFATPDFSNGHDARVQFQPFANTSHMNMNGVSAGSFGQETGYQVPGQQQQQCYQQDNFGIGMNGMNGFNGANNTYQSPPYNGQIGGLQNPQIGNGQVGNQHQHQLSFNGHCAPTQPGFQHQNMGMRPQLPPLATQFPANPYNPQYNQTYSAPPTGMHGQQFHNGGGGNNNYRGLNSTSGSASSMVSNLNFGSLSLGMSPNSIGPNGNQNNGYGHVNGNSNGNSNGNGNGNGIRNGMMQNHTNGNFQAAAVNNNPAANARNAPYLTLPSVGSIYHPLPPKPQFNAQKADTAKPDLGHHAYVAINSNPQSVVHTPQQQNQSVQSQQGSNSIQSPVSSSDFPVSATASEPRANFTPMLRSSRGKTITASADRAQQVNDWVQNTPTRGSFSRENSITGDGVVEVDNTPKMLDFIAEGVERDVNGSHERMPGAAGFTPRPLAINPFNPITALTSFSPNSRFGAGGGMSSLLRELTRNGTSVPTADEALDMRFLPFEEYCRQAKPVQWGVMRIKNIPYGVTRQEILAFLGRNARIAAADDHEPIHIIMERVTSKTLDAYVEFISFSEAANAVQRFDTNRIGGRGGRLGQRHVEVELSSQEELMKQLFPKAKNVKWHGSKPEIIARDENDRYNSGFQGFVSREELVMLVKHVESPQRSPFSKDCPQRPFECLVSTLIKFPWAMVDHVTCLDRELLYKATIQLLALLVERVDNNDDPLNLNAQLLKRVWRTALKCEGFSPCMKDNIVFKMNIDPQIALELGVPPQADLWSYVWTIGPRKDVAYDLVEYYIKLIHDATADKKQLTLAEKAAARATEIPRVPNIFGNMDKLVDYTDCMDLTLAALALKEWTAFEQVIRQALTPALEAGPCT